jgi:hypothetical protein
MLAALLGAYGDVRAETSGQITIGPLAMAYRGDRLTEEEENEIQPLRFGPYLITFDGRPDNREEIAQRLNRSPRGTSDPALILPVRHVSRSSLASSAGIRKGFAPVLGTCFINSLPSLVISAQLLIAMPSSFTLRSQTAANTKTSWSGSLIRYGVFPPILAQVPFVE